MGKAQSRRVSVTNSVERVQRGEEGRAGHGFKGTDADKTRAAMVEFFDKHLQK